MVNDFPDLLSSTGEVRPDRSGSHLGWLVDMLGQRQILLTRTGVRLEGCGRGAVRLNVGREGAEPLLLHEEPGVQVIVLLWRAAQSLLQVQPGQGVLLIVSVVSGAPGMVAVLYEVLRGHPAVHGLGGVQQGHAGLGSNHGEEFTC